MTYKRQGWHARTGATVVAAVAVMASFLAPTVSAASAATTTTTTLPAPTTTTTAVPGSNCAASATGSALGRTGWVASSNAPSASGDAPQYAVDGNLATRFSTNEHQAVGLYFEVDLGSPGTFDELDMASPGSPNDFARGYDVKVWTDDSYWATVATCTGTASPEIVSFVSQTARYIRVVLTTATPTDWWSIDEFNLYGKTAATTTTTRPTTTTTTVAHTTTSVSSSANPVSVGLAVTYTAKVVPIPAGGTVNFFANGAPVLGCYRVAVSTATGEASCSTMYVSNGDFGVQAFYSGFTRSRLSTSNLYAEVVTLPAPGYWLATSNGQVYGSGAAHPLGGTTTTSTSGPVVGIAATPSATGYWVVTSDGTVTALGNAKFYGDLPDLGKHVTDIVAIAPTIDGNGYYLVGADGGFFTFGDAKFHGSLPGIGLHVTDVVGMVSSPGGAGYLLVGSDGGVFTFGTTRFYGSLPGIGKHVHDIRAILPSSTGRGYILVGADGGAFNFGTGAKFHGSLPGEGVTVSNIVGLALSPDNGGYYMAGAGGHVYGFGDASVWAEVAGVASNLPVAAIAGT